MSPVYGYSLTNNTGSEFIFSALTSLIGGPMLKDILVHLDNSKQNDARFEVAVSLAKANEAHLTGIYTVSRPVIPPFIEAQISAEVIGAQLSMAEEEGQAVIAKFKELASAEGLSVEGRLVESEPIDALVRHARYADLLVLGQANPDIGNVGMDDDLPDRIVLSSGRPVLLVPYAGRFRGLPEIVVVAWDASRQSTRAVNDALPILRLAKKVSVLSINPDDHDHGDLPGADICLHLARHGVNAIAQHVTSNELKAADILLSRAADEGADMIVMGGYGHARWRELVLGGFTRHMLAHMTVPVLMSN